MGEEKCETGEVLSLSDLLQGRFWIHETTKSNIYLDVGLRDNVLDGIRSVKGRDLCFARAEELSLPLMSIPCQSGNSLLFECQYSCLLLSEFCTVSLFLGP
jgi:hypothetical protein